MINIKKSFTPHLLEGKKERISSKPFKKGEGFTLIELMVVISIIGLISSIVLVSVKSVRERARKAAGLQFAASVHHALGAEAVGIWDFDEGSGTTANDSSGYNNHCTLNNFAPPYGYVTDTPIGKGYALSFDGSNDYINCGSGTSLNITGAITIGAWVYWKGSGTTVHFITAKAIEQYEIHTGGGGGANGIRWIPRSSVRIDTGANKFPSNQWNHLVVTYVSATSVGKVYINGIDTQATQINSGALQASATNFQIGRRANATYYFNGTIDDVRIYGQALSEAQIQKLYAEGARERGLAVE